MYSKEQVELVYLCCLSIMALATLAQIGIRRPFPHGTPYDEGESRREPVIWNSLDDGGDPFEERTDGGRRLRSSVAPMLVIGDEDQRVTIERLDAYQRLVDLNSADEPALDMLPGIGPATAGAIVEYRRRHGPFRTVRDLEAVPGIGPRTVNRLTGMVTMNGRPL